MVLYWNRFVTFFTQIVYKKQIKNRENIFNLTVQYLEKYSSYITTAFVQTLYYCILYNTA